MHSWTTDVCWAHACEAAEVEACVAALALLDASGTGELPANVVVRDADKTTLGITEAFVLLAARDGSGEVHGLDITFFPVAGGGADRRVFQLPVVIGAGRRARLVAFGEHIETSSETMTSAQYKCVYDALKALYDANEAAARRE